jgi:hypothetical protein
MVTLTASLSETLLWSRVVSFAFQLNNLGTDWTPTSLSHIYLL